MEIVGVFIVTSFIFFLIVILYRQKKRKTPQPMSNTYRTLLYDHVPFYRLLDPIGKNSFENRMMHFYASVQISGIHTKVEDIDKVFIAASAIIPIFGFPDWEYPNLKEVLLYPDAFDHETFDMKSANKNTLGVVGTYAFHNVMILSKISLRNSFLNKTGKDNVPIHEFTHLIDKVDGTVDGIPESLLDKEYVIPWIEMMQKKAHEMAEGHSDIDPYGLTNRAEFFAVVSEYFFERPDLLEKKHPELFALLAEMFRQKPRIEIK